MITTFGVTASTVTRPIAVVAPICHRPHASPVVNTSLHGPCSDPGASDVVLLPTSETTTTTTTLKDLTVPCSGAASSNTVRETTGKHPATVGRRSVPTLRTAPFRNSLPNAVLRTSLLGNAAQGTSLLGNAAQGTSLLGNAAQGASLLGTTAQETTWPGASSLSFPCSETTLTWSGSDSGAASHECCQFDSRATRDRRSASVLGHPCADLDKTSGDVAEAMAASLRRWMLDSGGKTNDDWPNVIPKETNASSVSLTPSSQSVDPLLALSPREPRDLSRAVDECNFYYGSMTNTEAKSRLHRCSVGTFLLRDSSDPRFCYSLSVKTARGTTSIRIVSTSTGQFRLDSDPHQESRMPAFRWILSLAEHYFLSASSANPSSQKGRHRGQCVLLESSGRYDTPMVLRKPLEVSPAPLAHLCRRTINHLAPSPEDRKKLIDNPDLEVDAQRRKAVQEYMMGYPFRV